MLPRKYDSRTNVVFDWRMRTVLPIWTFNGGGEYFTWGIIDNVYCTGNMVSCTWTILVFSRWHKFKINSREKIQCKNRTTIDSVSNLVGKLFCTSKTKDLCYCKQTNNKPQTKLESILPRNLATFWIRVTACFYKPGSVV